VRVVVDTNVWVSGILASEGGPARLVTAFLAGRFTLVTSTPLLAEVESVLARPRIARRSRLTRTEVVDLVASMRDLSDVVPVSGERGICRDPDDDVVIETAIGGLADLLVSGDADLMSDPAVIALMAKAGIRLLTVAECVAELDTKTS
jgi:putative PIN family toxin of toxin-antitoxin system